METRPSECETYGLFALSNDFLGEGFVAMVGGVLKNKGKEEWRLCV